MNPAKNFQQEILPGLKPHTDPVDTRFFIAEGLFQGERSRVYFDGDLGIVGNRKDFL